MGKRIVRESKLVGGAKSRTTQKPNDTLRKDFTMYGNRLSKLGKKHHLRGQGGAFERGGKTTYWLGYYTSGEASTPKIAYERLSKMIDSDAKDGLFDDDPWTKKNKNEWVWNEDPEFSVKIYKYEGMRYYGADVWWQGHSAEIDGASTRGDINYLVMDFLKNENPRKHFEKTHRFTLEEIGYKKEE